MPDLDRNGVHLYYEDLGAGLPLLLSHSWFCNGHQWPQVPDLTAAGYRVLNLDNRGHGRSGPYAEPYSLWEMSEDLMAAGARGRIRRGTSNDKARTPSRRWCFRWWDGVPGWWS